MLVLLILLASEQVTDIWERSIDPDLAGKIPGHVSQTSSCTMEAVVSTGRLLTISHDRTLCRL